MISYKDMTFCNDYITCKEGDNCFRALTPDVLEDAKKWWGDDDAPISVYSNEPSCYEYCFEEAQL